MKRHLKNVSLLVSLLTLLSAVSFVGGGAVATAEISVETEAGLLGALGIIDDKQFFVSNDNITRGELAELFAKATNHAGSDAESSVFADVPATHAKARYIYAAAALRLVNGYSDGRFMPDNKATWEETVKIAVTVLGYGSNAQFKGGYPMGYLTLANELGILRGIPYQSSLLVSRRDIVRFLYNVLKADMAVVKGIVVSDGESLDVQSKSTMLAEYFDVYERAGKVTANHNSAIYGKSNLKKGFVEIENTTYDAGDSGTSALLGYMARFFYQDNDSDTPVILYAYKDPSRNDEFTVLAEDLVNASASSVTYSVNGRTKTASVPVDADLIFNGKAQTSFDGTMLRPQAGSVTFVTVGNGSTNNLIIVNSWENCVVNAVNTMDKIILDKYLPERNIHLDKTAAGEDVDYTVTDKGGEPFALSSIREWHVLSFKRSIDGSLVEIVVSAQSVIGTADEIGENTVSIGGTEYEYAES
ncbi:MAG: S-layer homology domain-containing protein, partial [Clostridiales bacterium]|nr:S-layer homology domain-containing protein [Clostridiales bacterium]